MNKKIKYISGTVFALIFVGTYIFFAGRYTDWRDNLINALLIAEATVAALCFVPKSNAVIKKEREKIGKRTLIALISVLILIPLTIWCGVTLLGDRKYYFICLMIIFEILIPFFIHIEGKKINAREIVIVSVLCALTVAGRLVFSFLPQFKPVVAMVIIVGICLGGETGFLVGAMSAFVSNFFFTQGAWTPWQMMGLGMVGFIAGIFFRLLPVCKNRIGMAIFGFLSVVLIYSPIVNMSSVLFMYPNPGIKEIAITYVMGLPFDLIHGLSTVAFLLIIGEPMIEKIERVKIKYELR